MNKDQTTEVTEELFDLRKQNLNLRVHGEKSLCTPCSNSLISKKKALCTLWLIGSEGFSLIELLVVMAIFVIVIAIGANTFTLLLKQSTQQNKITESQIERIAGYEMLRRDVASAGFGLPWSFQNTISYSEAVDTYASPIPLASTYNDAPGNVPRAILSGNNVGINGSDYLVIKATVFGNSTAASKWSYIVQGTTVPNSWGGSNDLADGVDQVIVIAPQVSDTVLRQLVMSGSTPYFYTTYSKNTFSSNFSPVSLGSMYMIYGVDSTALRMPFNRVDYFIWKDTAATSLVPSYCAPGTGELVRAYVSQSNGQLSNPPLPILDCVADMQVVYQLDPNGNGNLQPTDDISIYSAPTIAQQLKEVDIYILTHEGKKDPNFTYPVSSNPIAVGPAGYGSSFDLSAKIGTGWQNYRWKVQTLIVKPKNLY